MGRCEGVEVKGMGWGCEGGREGVQWVRGEVGDEMV